MFSESEITEIFFICDEFHKRFEQTARQRMVGSPQEPLRRMYHRASVTAIPEVMSILLMFHGSGYRFLKRFYLNEIKKNRADLFPRRVSYSRFVELQKEAMLPLGVLLKTRQLWRCTGIK